MRSASGAMRASIRAVRPACWGMAEDTPMEYCTGVCLTVQLAGAATYATLGYDRAGTFRWWTVGSLGSGRLECAARAVPAGSDCGRFGGRVERVGHRRGMHSGGTGAAVAGPGDGPGDASRTARHGLPAGRAIARQSPRVVRALPAARAVRADHGGASLAEVPHRAGPRHHVAVPGGVVRRPGRV